MAGYYRLAHGFADIRSYCLHFLGLFPGCLERSYASDYPLVPRQMESALLCWPLYARVLMACSTPKPDSGTSPNGETTQRRGTSGSTGPLFERSESRGPGDRRAWLGLVRQRPIGQVT